jgi:hypothetical protein
MDINLLNKQKVDEWLSQFLNEDKQKALALIEDINFIDQEDYDRHTSNIVNKIVKLSENFANIYLIPINSLVKIDEPKSDSAFVFNIKKKLPSSIRPIWNFNERIEGKSIIFFIDEFIGSGNTFVDNIKNIEENILKRIRSLSSFGKIQIDIISLVIYQEAITLLKNNFKFINSFEYEIEGTSFFQRKYKNFLEKYITKSHCKKALFGYNKDKEKYGGVFSNIVFYNNCPNNTPSILWCQQKNKATPLFHNKKVNLQYRTAFFREKQKYQKALNHLDKKTDLKLLTSFIKKENYSLVLDTIIFLSKRKTMTIQKFKFYSKYSDSRLKETIDKAQQYKLILTKRTNGKLSKDGQVLINKIEKVYNIFFKDIKIEVKPCEHQATLLYYPSQIKGIKPNV